MAKTSNRYLKNLCGVILDNSKANNWDEAVKEWEIVDYRYDESGEMCICGKEDIMHIYTIYNRTTDKTIDTIGSSCIHKFERKELDMKARLFQEQTNLMHAAIDAHDICKVPFTSKHYSKNLIKKMYEDDAFEANKYNAYNAFNDYEFLLKMFNKRSEPTENEKKKLYVLTKNYIRPWLAEHWRVWNQTNPPK